MWGLKICVQFWKRQFMFFRNWAGGGTCPSRPPWDLHPWSDSTVGSTMFGPGSSRWDVGWPDSMFYEWTGTFHGCHGSSPGASLGPYQNIWKTPKYFHNIFTPSGRFLYEKKHLLKIALASSVTDKRTFVKKKVRFINISLSSVLFSMFDCKPCRIHWFKLACIASIGSNFS